MTAQLSWHVQNFMVIASLQLGENRIKFSLNLNYDGKIVHEMGPSVLVEFASIALTHPNLNHLLNLGRHNLISLLLFCLFYRCSVSG